MGVDQAGNDDEAARVDGLGVGGVDIRRTAAMRSPSISTDPRGNSPSPGLIVTT